MTAYSQSNVARVMFVKRLSEKLKGQGIRVLSIDPGGTSLLTFLKNTAN